MSGHSKWATTKHKKAAADSKRGKSFTKLIKEITVSARLGGGDPDGNPRLRAAIQKSKEQNMPADNIKRAIMKGTGELPGVSYEEILYEGYGPGGTAMLVEIMTDNKNRTVAEIRHVFSKHGGHMGEAGCVGWMFHMAGDIVVDKNKADEDTLLTLALEAGADDMKSDDPDQFEILMAPGEMWGEEGPGGEGDPHRARRGDADPADLREARGPGRRADAQADGSPRGSRRRAESPRQFRHRARGDGEGAGVSPDGLSRARVFAASIRPVGRSRPCASWGSIPV